MAVDEHFQCISECLDVETMCKPFCSSRELYLVTADNAIVTALPIIIECPC